jgi:hypothetical protein
VLLLITTSQLASDAATIEGIVFEFEHRRTPQRLPYPGVSLILLRASAGPGDQLQEVARTKSGSHGKYSFKGIAPGKYIIRALGPDHPVKLMPSISTYRL